MRGANKVEKEVALAPCGTATATTYKSSVSDPLDVLFVADVVRGLSRTKISKKALRVRTLRAVVSPCTAISPYGLSIELQQ